MRILQRRQSHGFTLVESLMACVVLAISVAAIASMLMAAMGNSQAVQTHTVMIDTARRSMEDLSAQSFDSIRSGANTLNSTTLDLSTKLPSTQPAAVITDASGRVTADETPSVRVGATLTYIARNGAVPNQTMGVVTTTVSDARGRTLTFKRLVTSAQVDRP